MLIINDCFGEIDVIDVLKLMWGYMDNVIWILDIIDMIHESMNNLLTPSITLVCKDIFSPSHQITIVEI